MSCSSILWASFFSSWVNKTTFSYVLFLWNALKQSLTLSEECSSNELVLSFFSWASIPFYRSVRTILESSFFFSTLVPVVHSALWSFYSVFSTSWKERKPVCIQCTLWSLRISFLSFVSFFSSLQRISSIYSSLLNLALDCHTPLS